MSKMTRCTHCSGTGIEPATEYSQSDHASPCHVCDGTGEIVLAGYRIPAGDLNMSYFGKTITARQGAATVSGVLCHVEHTADVIEDGPGWGNSLPAYVIGRTKTTVTVMPSIRLDLGPDTLVEVSE